MKVPVRDVGKVKVTRRRVEKGTEACYSVWGSNRRFPVIEFLLGRSSALDLAPVRGCETRRQHSLVLKKSNSCFDTESKKTTELDLR